MAIRAVPVPAYTTNTVDDHAHLLRDSGARAAIVSSAALADRLLAAAAKVGGPGSAGGRWTATPAADAGHAARRSMPWAGADRGSAAAGRHRGGGGADPGDRAGLPDLHLRHRRLAARA